MKFLQVVKLLVFSYIRNVVVGVVTVVAKVCTKPSGVPRVRIEVRVPSVLVPVVDFVVYSHFAVKADAKLMSSLSYEWWIDRVDSTRVVLINER